MEFTYDEGYTKEQVEAMERFFFQTGVKFVAQMTREEEQSEYKMGTSAGSWEDYF